MNFSQKQIDKFNRQKYINELEKIAKNLFRMLRDSKITSAIFMLEFERLKKKFGEKKTIHLDSEYHQQLKLYIERLYQQTCIVEEFSNKNFDDIREAEMSNLNRLQKLKNATSYKKDKHKNKHKNEDWG